MLRSWALNSFYEIFVFFHMFLIICLDKRRFGHIMDAKQIDRGAVCQEYLSKHGRTSGEKKGLLPKQTAALSGAGLLGRRIISAGLSRKWSAVMLSRLPSFQAVLLVMHRCSAGHGDFLLPASQ